MGLRFWKLKLIIPANHPNSRGVSFSVAFLIEDVEFEQCYESVSVLIFYVLEQEVENRELMIKHWNILTQPGPNCLSQKNETNQLQLRSFWIPELALEERSVDPAHQMFCSLTFQTRCKMRAENFGVSQPITVLFISQTVSWNMPPPKCPHQL